MKIYNYIFLFVFFVPLLVLAQPLDFHIKGQSGESLATPLPTIAQVINFPSKIVALRKALESIQKSQRKAPAFVLNEFPNCYQDTASKKIGKNKLEKQPYLDYIFLDSRHRGLSVDTTFGEFAQPYFVDEKLGNLYANFLEVTCTPYRVVIFNERDIAPVIYKGDQAFTLIGVKQNSKIRRH